LVNGSFIGSLVNSTRIGIKLPVDIVYCVRSSLPHATR